ncbi:MAG: hypothetical protein HQ458_00035 [Chloroflexi bacterium]|nr:hypothetical protein [Chloroflexota bacterium]
MFARLGNALLALSLVFVFSAASVTSTKATGATGPIQIGGDDANDHGEADWLDHDANTATPDVVTVLDGWEYIEVSLKQMLATEQRANAINSIAVIGTDGTTAYVTGEGWTENDGGVSCVNDDSSDTYCMMEVIKAELDRLNGATAAPTVTYYETAAEVTAFFNALTAGTTNVAVVYIPGDDGDNDLADGATDDDTVNDDPLVTTPMEQALIDSASDIATFNVQGGGLLSSGSDNYLSWLSILIPTIGISDDPTSNYIKITADGAALWVGLTDADINAPWHNHFTGSLGALKVLGLGYDNWTDTNTNNMIDTGEAEALIWDGPDGIQGNADDVHTRAIIGGAAGEAALGEELPPTNTSGDASASWALLVAALAAVAGLALRVVERKRLQA